MKLIAPLFSLTALIFLVLVNSCLADNLAIKKSTQGIAYVTGGISDDEVEALRPYTKKFSLHLVFSEGVSGRSITDIDVNIYNTDSKLVFKTIKAQPQLFVDLPAGTYTIVAKYNENKQRYKFELAANEHKKIILNWKNLTDEDAADEEAQ
ncbi:MAG TPA: hypothetical protein DCO68_04635 [Methylophilaceae bacterium]|nr:hypothetical protein [Methylophilaceae bacterium]HAJ71345.1 hypothetical protein [Methylophilaceae bacterium]